MSVTLVESVVALERALSSLPWKNFACGLIFLFGGGV